MKLESNDFELFGMSERFTVDRAQLDKRWRELQGEVHPDRFASQGSAAQRVAMQWAVRVNEAYRRLKNPVDRAAYICSLHGAGVDAENNTAMPAGFLIQQMEWREALDDAGDLAAVEQLAAEVSDERDAKFLLLEQFIDLDHDYAAAAGATRALMFIERFADDIDRRMEALGQ
jgi:molecular chaperone HscB